MHLVKENTDYPIVDGYQCNSNEENKIRGIRIYDESGWIDYT
jgi:hypothetical protein